MDRTVPRLPRPSKEERLFGTMVLLIASTEPSELTHNEAYRDGIGPNAILWYISDVGHVQGLSVHADEYTARVATFLQASLA